MYVNLTWKNTMWLPLWVLLWGCVVCSAVTLLCALFWQELLHVVPCDVVYWHDLVTATLKTGIYPDGLENRWKSSGPIQDGAILAKFKHLEKDGWFPVELRRQQGASQDWWRLRGLKNSFLCLHEWSWPLGNSCAAGGHLNLWDGAVFPFQQTIPSSISLGLSHHHLEKSTWSFPCQWPLFLRRQNQSCVR